MTLYRRRIIDQCVCYATYQKSLREYQINSFVENKISKCVTGFRKSNGTQHSLVVMLEKWRKALDKEENMFIFMDLSKASDTINHDLLLAKVKAYGFSKQALSFMCS